MRVVATCTRMNVSNAGRTLGYRGANTWGPCLDTFVSQQVIAALEPAALELSLTATERVEQERAELDRHGPQRRERAAYDVERAAHKSPCRRTGASARGPDAGTRLGREAGGKASA
jgi:hypothetical protein